MRFPFLSKKKSFSDAPVSEPQRISSSDTEINLSKIKSDIEDMLDTMVNTNSIVDSGKKAFDWNHYSTINEGGLNGMYQGEFATLPNLQTLKSLWMRENWVGIGVDSICKQFLTAKFILKKENEDGSMEITKRNPSIDLLNKVESKFFFELMADLILTGQGYFWTRPDGDNLVMLPAEKIEAKYGIKEDGRFGVIQYEYQKTNGKDKLEIIVIPAIEVTHIKMPNPFSPLFGMPMLVSAAMPILIDRYGKEYVISFFIRGGTTAGICETQATSSDQITRLMKTIQTAFSTRRNMHSDKILPMGVNWKTRGLSFSEIMFDTLQDKNAKQILARLGVPPVCAGMTESVNYANAEAQLEQFHRQTILPLANLLCTGIQRGSFGQQFEISENGLSLEIDFSDNRYVNEFQKKLDEDAKLAQFISINERRQRLGFQGLPSNDSRGELLGFELNKQTANPFGLLSMDASQAKSTTEIETQQATEEITPVVESVRGSFKTSQDNFERAIPKSVNDLFYREFGAWEQIVLDNPNSEAVATDKILKRADKFSSDYSEEVIDYAMRAYDAQMARAVKSFYANPKHKATTQTEAERQENLAAVRNRSKKLIAGKIKNIEHGRFEGYSKSEMIRVYNQIQKDMDEGKGSDEIATGIRRKFGEFYSGQSNTIIRTEYGSAMAESQGQFSKDLGTQCNTIRKVWLSIVDDYTRESHVTADGLEIEGKSDLVLSKKFSEINADAPDLLYPKQEGGEPGEIINCRCQVSYEPIEWKD